jgi:hypothetical protein
MPSKEQYPEVSCTKIIQSRYFNLYSNLPFTDLCSNFFGFHLMSTGLLSVKRCQVNITSKIQITVMMVLYSTYKVFNIQFDNINIISKYSKFHMLNYAKTICKLQGFLHVMIHSQQPLLWPNMDKINYEKIQLYENRTTEINTWDNLLKCTSC